MAEPGSRGHRIQDDCICGSRTGDSFVSAVDDFRTGAAVVADTDIALFFFTTPAGAVALLLGSAILISITALESACLMVIGLAATRGIRVSATAAILFAGARAGAILRLAARIVVRVLVTLLPFALAAGAVYFGLLRGHDINFYLSRKPTEFWIAAALVAAIVVVLVVLLLRLLARWALALPLLLFEGISPRRVLQESTRRTQGNHSLVLLVIGVWCGIAVALSSALTFVMGLIGRELRPTIPAQLGHSLCSSLSWHLSGLC